MKKGQQPKLFLDKIDGSIPLPEADDTPEFYARIGDYLTYHFFEAYRHNVTQLYRKDEKGDFVARSAISAEGIKKIADYLVRNNVPDELKKAILQSFEADPFAKVAALSYKKYKENDSKNYIISSPLTKCLSKMNLDVSSDMLPQNFSAYFQPTGLTESEGDNSLVYGAFAYVGRVHEVDVLAVTLFTENKHVIETEYKKNMYAYRTCLIPKEEGTLEGLCAKYARRNGPEESDLEFIGDRWIKRENSMKELTALRAIVNAILYVSNPNEEFIEQYNLFAKDGKKRQVQEKSLTTKGFCKIGYDNAEFLKMLVEKEVSVKWHMRNQPYGPGNKLRKKILIAPHTRVYKNFFEQNDN